MNSSSQVVPNTPDVLVCNEAAARKYAAALWFRVYFCLGVAGNPILVLWSFSQTPTRRRLRDVRV
jgi:hypothetical protein